MRSTSIIVVAWPVATREPHDAVVACLTLHNGRPDPNGRTVVIGFEEQYENCVDVDEDDTDMVVCGLCRPSSSVASQDRLCATRPTRADEHHMSRRREGESGTVVRQGGFVIEASV